MSLRNGIADACISIAVIHHLATEERRVQAIRDMSNLLVRGGRALIYVWAREQQRGDKKSTYLLQQSRNSEAPKKEVKDCRSSSGGGGGLLPVHENRTDFQHSDVLVPWKLNPKTSSLKDDESAREKTFHRFYHVFTEGELEGLCRQVAELSVVRSYYDQGNWCVILEKNA